MKVDLEALEAEALEWLYPSQKLALMIAATVAELRAARAVVEAAKEWRNWFLGIAKPAIFEVRRTAAHQLNAAISKYDEATEGK